MNIYVAGAWSDRAHVADLAERLAIAAGGSLTARWWEMEAPGDSRSEIEQRRLWRDLALYDLRGVNRADALVVVHHEDTRGAWLEMGYAIGVSKPILVLDDGSPRVRYSPFMHLPSVSLHPDEASLARALGVLAKAMPEVA